MEHPSALAFRQEIKRRRLENGWTMDNVESELGLSRGVISRWENGKKRPHFRKVGLIRDLLEMDEAITDRYLAYRANVEASPYTYGSLSDLCRRGYDEDEIIIGASEVYSQYPEPTLPEGYDGSNDYGSNEKWFRLQRSFPESFFGVLSTQDNKVKAYLHILSLTDEAYESGVEGENINKGLTLADCKGFLIPENHNLYIVDVFTDRFAKDPVINEILMNLFTSFLLSLVNTGHTIRRMMANASDYEAINYCKTLNFRKACDHLYHRMYDPEVENKHPPTQIWELEVNKNPDSRLFEVRPALKKLLSI